jgi:hypothetical protein
MAIVRSDWTREGEDDPEREIIRARTAMAWSVLERAMKPKRKLDTLSIRSAEVTLDRYEPAPKAPMLAAQFTGPVVLTWQSDGSRSLMLPAPSNESSTTLGADNGHGQPSSSATDSLEKL